MSGLPDLTGSSDPPAQPAPQRRRVAALAALTLIPAIVGGGVAFAVARTTDGSSTTSTVTVAQSGAEPAATTTVTVPAPSGGSANGPDIPSIVRATRPGVVLVETNSGLGSGFVIDRKGHILTNAHVVDDARSMDVTYHDGTVQRARLIASDPAIDLAVLESPGLPESATVLPLGTSKGLQAGEPTIAIGNPLGQESSVTSGIVSATKRTICSPDQNFIGNAIQTDAAINPGNSGGPLLNARGQVIGINSQILSQGGGNEGIGFAVPIDIIRPVSDSIVADGIPRHAWIGVVGEALTPQSADEIGLAGTRGVVLRSVNPNGPAGRAGLRGSPAAEDEPPRGGDIIVAISGDTVIDFADLTQGVSSRGVGEKITLTILRDGSKRDVTLTLADRPASIGTGECRE